MGHLEIIVKDKTKIIKGRKSMYVKLLDFKPKELIKIKNLMKEMPVCYFNKSNNNYELPTGDFNIFLEKFCNYDMEFIGKLTKNITNILDQEEEINNNKSVNKNEFEFTTKPFKHQEESFIYAKTHKKFLLGDEQGLGKTKQSIDIAVSKKGEFKHCLIVCCVNGLKWNWENEVKIHSKEKAHILGCYENSRGNLVIGSVEKRREDLLKNHDEYFLITNIETIRDKEIGKILKSMCISGDIGMVIIDEIHKCKNPTSKQGKSIHNLCSYYKIALTGTPLMNTPIDLYNVLKWLEVETHTLTAFKDYYCIMGGFGGYTIVGYKHLNQLQDLLNSCMLRRRKEDVLDLPPKIHTVEYVEMSKQQTKLYNDVKEEILDNIDKIVLLPNPLVELIRLRQVTGYPGILSSTITESQKLIRLKEIIEENVSNGKKCVIFSNWTKVIEPAREMLKEFNPVCILGETKDNDRKKAEKLFQTDDNTKVILGTIKAMGTGLTLTAGSVVIFLDSPWTRADKDQAEDRCHRIGTKETVNIITLVCKNTIDERIEDIVNGKGELSDMLVDNKQTIASKSSLLKFLLK